MTLRTLLVCALVCGCDAASVLDAGPDEEDSGRADAGKTDAGRDEDAGRDAGDLDDAGRDAGSPDAATCSTTLTALTDGLFYTSEGDMPIVVETFPGEGAAAPTEGDVLRLSGAPADATTELRDLDYFFAHVVIDPTRDPPIDPTLPDMLRSAAESELANIIVVRVTDPSDPVLIDVYLAGTNSCGDLVWLFSTAVET